MQEAAPARSSQVVVGANVNQSQELKQSQPVSGSIKLKKSEIAFSANRSNQNNEAAGGAADDSGEEAPRNGTVSRHSVMSRQSVREMAQKRPSAPTLHQAQAQGEEKDDKMSAT